MPALSETISGTNTAGKVIRQVASGIGEAIGFVVDLLSSDGAVGLSDSLVSAAQVAIPVIRDGLGQAFAAIADFAAQVLPVMADTFTNVVLPAIISLAEYVQANLLPVLLDIGHSRRGQRAAHPGVPGDPDLWDHLPGPD